MNIKGIHVRFPCEKGEQYEAIGRFWEEMAALFPLESLKGVGYGWEAGKLDYLIGREERDFCCDPAFLHPRFPAARLLYIELPNEGWEVYSGRREELKELYEKIYKKGPLLYEIEEFDSLGGARIRAFRR